MANTRRSVVYSTAANVGSLGLSLVLLIVVTRWLEPAEIGAFVVAYAVFAILEPVRMLQLIAYVIQADELDERLMRGVQFVGLLATAVIFTAAVVTGLLMRTVFDQQTVGNLLLMMSGGYIVKGIAQPAFAVLHRQMRFGFITGIKLGGAALKVGVTIGLLMLGWREEALAAGIVAEILAEIAGIFAVKRAYALPMPSREGTRPAWDYCLKFSGAQLVSNLPNSIIDLLIGGFLGLAAAGYFNRANRLIRTARSGIEAAIYPVALVVFSRAEKTNRAATRDQYLASIAMLTGVTWSGLGLLIALAEPLVLTAFGADWVAIIPLVQVLSFSAMVFATTAMAQPLLASIGAVGTLLKRNLLIQIPRLLIVLVTVQFDLITVAWGTVATMLIANIVTEQILKKELGIGYVHLYGALWRSAAVTLFCAVPPWLLLEYAGSWAMNEAVALIAAGSIGAVLWLAGIVLLQHPLAQELRHVIGKLRSAVSS